MELNRLDKVTLTEIDGAFQYEITGYTDAIEVVYIEGNEEVERYSIPTQLAKVLCKTIIELAGRIEED